MNDKELMLIFLAAFAFGALLLLTPAAAGGAGVMGGVLVAAIIYFIDKIVKSWK